METGAQAIRFRYRRFVRLFWALTLFVLIAGWFPSLAYVREWPLFVSQPILLLFIVMAFRRDNTCDRLVGIAFSILFLEGAELLLVRRPSGT